MAGARCPFLTTPLKKKKQTTNQREHTAPENVEKAKRNTKHNHGNNAENRKRKTAKH